MSDTVAVALIAVAGTLGSGALSYIASRRSTAAQLASVEVELRRLHASHAAEVRSERRELYHEFLAAVIDLEEIALGFNGPAAKRDYVEGITKCGRSFTVVLMLGDKDVTEAAEELNRAVAQFALSVAALAEEESEKEFSEILETAYEATEGEWVKARMSLVDAIRGDLGVEKIFSPKVAE